PNAPARRTPRQALRPADRRHGAGSTARFRPCGNVQTRMAVSGNRIGVVTRWMRPGRKTRPGTRQAHTRLLFLAGAIVLRGARTFAALDIPAPRSDAHTPRRHHGGDRVLVHHL